MPFAGIYEWQNPAIQEMTSFLSVPENDIATIRKTYLFVRDERKHSWDARDKRITVTASDVLRERVVIRRAKSNLPATLLRANHIPTGICYQWLTLGDTPETGCCIHAPNAAYVESLNRWIRLDARGNRKGVHWEMCLEEEKLAFPVRPESGEIDYKQIHVQPAPITMQILENSTGALYMYLHSLPEYL